MMTQARFNDRELHDERPFIKKSFTTSSERYLAIDRWHHKEVKFPIKPKRKTMNGNPRAQVDGTIGSGDGCENCKTINDRMGQLVIKKKKKSRENLL